MFNFSRLLPKLNRNLQRTGSGFRFRNMFPGVRNARYNVAAWQNADSGHLILVGRDVEKPNGPNEADVGPLILSEFDEDGKLLSEQTIWQPDTDNFFLEDPRAIVDPNGLIEIGLTAVLGTISHYETYGALVKIPKDWNRTLPPVTVIKEFGPSKNMTPMGRGMYLLRPWNTEYSHKLVLFHMVAEKAEKITDLLFSTTLPWAQLRIGTAMPPLWMDDGSGLMIIHGITREDEKDVYSIGLAQLIPRQIGYQVIVDPVPLLTPDTFVDKSGKNIIEELRPTEKRVVYACGGVVSQKDPDILSLFVNVGDRATLEVKFSISDLQARIDAYKSQSNLFQNKTDNQS